MNNFSDIPNITYFLPPEGLNLIEISEPYRRFGGVEAPIASSMGRNISAFTRWEISFAACLLWQLAATILFRF